MYLRGRKCSTRSPLLGEPPPGSPGHIALAGLPGVAISVVAAPQGHGPAGGPPTGTSESLHSARLVSGQLAISGPPLGGPCKSGRIRNLYFRSSRACDGSESGCDLPVICRIEIGAPDGTCVHARQRLTLAA